MGSVRTRRRMRIVAGGNCVTNAGRGGTPVDHDGKLGVRAMEK